MKSWYNSSELAGLPGLPTSSRGVLRKAERENWKCRNHKGRGGGKDFHYRSLPDETRVALAAKSLQTAKKDIVPTTTPRAKLNKINIKHIIRELSRVHVKLETIFNEERRLAGL